MPRGRTVRGALRRALLAGAIDRVRHDVHRRTWWRAQVAAERLSGHRRLELLAVLRGVDRIAAAGLLTTSRIELAMLTVRRNREFWSSRALPAAGSRFRFGGDPVVYQYYAGQGVHVQPLASFGAANALWRTCTADASRRGWRCRKRSLRKLLDRLLALGARRDGYLAFEYLVPFGGGSPPWVSGMTQATAAQAFARAAGELGEQRYRKAALDALGAFERRPPSGVAVTAPGGSHYLMYSFNPNMRILNGFLQTVRGLHDVAALTGSRRAKRLFRRADGVAASTLPAYDTGAWSLYASGGEETSLHYHRLTTDFAGGLCRVTHRARYCRAHRRFARYLTEPPRVRLDVARRARAGRRLAVSVTVSKRASVAVWAQRGGAVVLARRLSLGRGTHAIAWTPRRVGSHRFAVEAVGVNGRRATLTKAVAIQRPPKKRHAKRRADAPTKRRGGHRPDKGIVPVR